jgi:hypothetical protein
MIYITTAPQSERDPLLLRSRQSPLRAGFCVAPLHAIIVPTCVLAHWLGPRKERGPAELLFEGGVRTLVSEEAAHVHARNLRQSAIVGIVETCRSKPQTTEIRICHFCGKTLHEKWTHNVGGEVTAFALTDTCYVYCASNQYFLFNFSAETRVRLNAAAMSTACVSPVTSDSFAFVYKEFLLIADHRNEKGTALPYDRALGAPNWILAVQGAVYLFYDGRFTRIAIGTDETVEPMVFDIPDVRCAAMAEDTLLVVTSAGAKIVGSIPPSDEMARGITEKGMLEFDTIVRRMTRDGAAKAVLSVFCELWKLGRVDLAIAMLAKHVIVGNIAAVVALVPIIPLSEAPDPPLGLTPRPATETMHLRALTDALAFHRQKYATETADVFVREMPIIDTAYAQCLAVQCTDLAHTRELDRVLKDKAVKLDHFAAFLQSNAVRKAFPETFPAGAAVEGGPALAIYFANNEEVDRALAIWRGLHDAMAQRNRRDPLFVTEAAHAVQMLTDSHRLVEYLDWIYEVDDTRPEAAITALLSINHQPSVVEDWLKRRDLSRGPVVLRYHCFIMREANSARSAPFANDVMNQLLEILATIDGNIDVARLGFTEASQTHSGDLVALKAAAKDEITDLIFHILNKNPDSIVTADALARAHEPVDKRVRLAIYQAKRHYKEAIDVLIPDPSKFDFDEAAAFCRSAADPPAAFSALFTKVSIETILSQNMRALEDNLPWIDVVHLAGVIPPGTRLKTVETLLKGAFNLLIHRRQNLDAQRALSQHLLVNARVAAAELQNAYATIKQGTKCQGYQGTINETAFCVMAPGGSDGAVYHHNCRPRLKK